MMSMTAGAARRFLLVAILLAVATMVLISSGTSRADVSPAGCNANLLTIGVSRLPSGTVVNGQHVVYTVSVANPGRGSGTACDVTGAVVIFTCPGTDGTASGAQTTLSAAGGDNFPADNSGDKTYPSVDCQINITSAGTTTVTGKAETGFNNLADGVLHDSTNDDSFDRVNTVSNDFTAVVKVDKQISCDNGVTWVDQGLELANEDGTNGCAAIAGQPLLVRYQVQNAGTGTLYQCTINESNPGIGTGPGNIGNIAAGTTTAFFTDSDQNASAQLAAGEPDTATVSCFTTSDLNSDLKTSASDSATFSSNEPSVGIDNQVSCDGGATFVDSCSFPAGGPPGGAFPVRARVTNTGQVDLTNCNVVYNGYFGDPPPGGTATPVTVAPTPFDLAVGAPAEDVTGSITGATARFVTIANVTCNEGNTTSTIAASDTANVVGDFDLALTNVPSNITVNATSASGATVTYTTPTAVDEDTTAPSVTCAPASGSTFAIGTTTVNCSAPDTDDSNSPATASFTVTVVGALAQLQNLQTYVDSLPPGTSLPKKVQTAINYYQAGDIADTCKTLAAIISEAKAQTGKHLTAAQANAVITAAKRIRSVIGC